MRKKYTNVVAGIVLASVMMVGNTINTNAFSITNDGKGFSKAWELSVTSDDNKAILKYGFNTFAINEDYAHAYHSTKSHYAYLKNGKGSFSGKNKGSGSWSKIEITHKGSSIVYGNSYYK